MEPTSEQELRQLLNEGRITEDEYRELLEAIRQKETSKLTATETGHSKPQTNDWKMGALVGFSIVILMIVMALLIKFIFGIGRAESMVIIGIAALPVLLVIKGVLWFRQKNS